MNRTIKIVPAILTDDTDALISMVNQAKSFTDWVQIDIMDGQFVPSLSITPEELANIKPDISWEAHLMVNEPGKVLHLFKNAGAKRILFHYEATEDHAGVINTARALQLEVGIAINPQTQVDVLDTLAGSIDSVLFMTVNPGYYGAKFIPEVLDKVRKFRARWNKMEIGIDGGAKEENLKLIIESGANSICVGSAIFLSSNPPESYRHLTEVARS
jgi:ribulose-phosphate 3-epimerase